MTAVTMPARRWGDEAKPATPQPTVVVSSRDGFDVPHVAGAARLAKAAEAAGWTVRQTYAFAECPAGWTRGREAYRFASVAVRLRRGSVAGFAIWGSTDGGSWKFEGALLETRCLGLRAFTAAVTS